MANPNQFLEDYEHYKNQYYNNINPQSMDEYKKNLVANETLTSMVSLGVGNAIIKYGFFKVMDASYTKMNEEGNYSNSLKNMFNADIQSLPAGEFKNKLSEIAGKYRNTPTVLPYYVEIKAAIAEAENDPAAQTFLSKISEDVLTYFFRQDPNLTTSVFDKILETIPMTADMVPEEVMYKTFFEKEPVHIERTKINHLIDAENDKDETDLAYIAALGDSDNILTDIGKDNTVAGVAEELGRCCYKIIDAEYDSYARDNHITKFDSGTILGLPNGEIGPYYQNNIHGAFRPSFKYKDTLLKMIKFAREHHLVKTPEEAKTSNGTTRLNYAIDEKTKALKAAIESGNKDEIKKCYAETKEVENDIDYVISNLKSIDPKHLYIENLSDARVEFYPAKYRTDVEGSTLFNQMAYISDVCSRYDVKPEEMLNNPTEAVNKILADQFSHDGDFVKSFHAENPFKFAERKHDFNVSPAFLKLVDASNDVIQLAGCLATNNPENRIESYHYLSFTVDSKRFIFQNNRDMIESAMGNRNFYHNVLPIMIMTGKDFDPLHMINMEEPMVDIRTMQPIPRFDLKEYLKKTHVATWETMFDRLKVATTQASEVRSDDVYRRSRESLKITGNIVKEAITETLPVKPETVDMFVQEAIGEKAMTPIQRHTALAEMSFAESMKIGIGKDGIKNALSEIAYLQRRYDSHNFLAQIFYKNLRAQSDTLTEMKNKLVELGVDRQGLDQAIYNMNHNQEDKANGFAMQYARDEVKENQKEDVHKNKIPVIFNEKDNLDNSMDVSEDFNLYKSKKVEKPAPEKPGMSEKD